MRKKGKEMIHMHVALPPLGWNSWNTFGSNISDELIRETARIMKEKGYLEAGYEYIVIDDCWSLRERDENGKLVPDPKKFPYGMKALADYVHSLGFKFGMYSCAGVMTCAGYPSSYDHEYEDAKQFAEWGVDFLKYDFCYFPENADNRHRYATMSMALKASGRDILLSACNWGSGEPWKWMKSVGAGMYRSTGDIFDNFRSFSEIFKSQMNNFCMSGPGCFNDIDMLTVGMYGKGNVGLGAKCTDEDYRTQFSMWAMFSAPLMLGGDVRNMNEFCEKLVLNKDLLRINQDEECRPPYVSYRGRVICSGFEENGETVGWREFPDCGLVMIKHMSNNEFALAYFNLAEYPATITGTFADMGIPYKSGVGLELKDVFTGENLGVKRDYYNALVPAHGCKVYLAKMQHV